MKNTKRDYVEVIYSPEDRPLTSYPEKLASYLSKRFSLQPNMSILDIGCGRGEFLNGFEKLGLNGFGVDLSKAAMAYFPKSKIKVANIELDGLPYADDSFDVVFSKSVIEHFYDPDRLAQEMFRVLKPGGVAITLCPSWEYNYKIYFEDYTHRTPFMKDSLRAVQIINGFHSVKVDYFRQLPLLWKFPWILPLSVVSIYIFPSFMRRFSKWIRFSKEVMLLSSSRKP